MHQPGEAGISGNYYLVIPLVTMQVLYLFQSAGSGGDSGLRSG